MARITQTWLVGAPDVVKATCPVRGALGGIPLLRGSMDAVLRLHCVSHNCGWMSRSVKWQINFCGAHPVFPGMAVLKPLVSWIEDI
jgi:hypothetical protein